MALKIRLRQQGRTNRQTFRLVVTDIRNPRDGKYLEVLGAYDPFRAENNFSLNADRLSYWLGLGAELSESAEQLIAKKSPDLIKALHAKQHAKRVKLAGKRRSMKKKKTAAPVKKAAPEKPAAAPKAKAPAKKAKAPATGSRAEAAAE